MKYVIYICTFFFVANSYGAAVSYPSSDISSFNDNPEAFLDLFYSLDEEHQQMVFDTYNEHAENALQQRASDCLLDTFKTPIREYETLMQQVASNKKINGCHALDVCKRAGLARTVPLIKHVIAHDKKHHKAIFNLMHQKPLTECSRGEIDPHMHIAPIDVTQASDLLSRLAQHGYAPAQVQQALLHTHRAQHMSKQDPDAAEKEQKKARHLFAQAADHSARAAYEYAGILSEEKRYDEANHLLARISDDMPQAFIAQGNIQEMIARQCDQSLLLSDQKSLATNVRRRRSKKNRAQRGTKEQDTRAIQHEKRALKLYEQAVKRGIQEGYYHAGMLHMRSINATQAKRIKQESNALNKANDPKYVYSTENQQLYSAHNLAQQALSLWKQKVSDTTSARNKAETAIGKYITEGNRGNQAAWVYLAQFYKHLFEAEQAWRMKQARILFEKALFVNRNDHKSRMELASCFAFEGETIAAAELLKDAYNLGPQNIDALRKLGPMSVTLIESPSTNLDLHYAKSIAAFVAKHMGHTADTWYTFGYHAYKLGELAQAKDYFLKAGKLGSAKAWFLAGNTERILGNDAQAKEYLKQSLQIHKENPDALLSLADICKQKANDRKMRDYFLQAAQLGDCEGAFQAAQCFHHGLGGIADLDRARAHYEQAAQRHSSPDGRRACSSLAQLCTLQNPKTWLSFNKEQTQEVQKTINEILRQVEEQPAHELIMVLAREAHQAQAQYYITLVRKNDLWIKRSKVIIDQLKQNYAQNKNKITQLLTDTITQQQQYNKNKERAITHLKKAAEGSNSAYHLFNRAQFRQELLPELKTKAEMNAQELADCKEVKQLYKQLVHNFQKKHPDSPFVFKARCQLAQLYRQIDPDHADKKIWHICTSGTEPNDARTHLTLAHAFQSGLFNQGTPNNLEAMKCIKKALECKPKSARLSKEESYYRYILNGSKIPEENIDEYMFLQTIVLLARKTFGCNIEQATPVQRLYIYRMVYFANKQLVEDPHLAQTMLDTYKKQEAASSSDAISPVNH